MSKLFTSVLCAILLSTYSVAAPASTSSATTTTFSSKMSTIISTSPTSGTFTSSAPSSMPTVPLASDDPNFPEWNTTTTTDPQPIRGSLGATILGPQNVALQEQNPDILAPPTTDSGSVPNIKWPFSLSHNRLQTGGWARQQNTAQLPVDQSMAGVNMRLEPGAIRELHWHKTAEWAYVLSGTTQITAMDNDGRNFVANVGPGDLWYFPPGLPHSLQALGDEGSEFVLVLPDGSFDDFTQSFQLTEWLAHVPKEVLARNFMTDISAFNNIPGEELYIFPGQVPTSDTPVSDPQGQVPSPYAFNFSQVPLIQYTGGTAKIADSTSFAISTTIAVAVLHIEPGAMRSLHWHPQEDEWAFYLEGSARMTLFAADGNAQTFDFEAGDIGFAPATYGHYIENIGNTTLTLLEIFNTPVFQDVGLSQWLALTPPELVKAHLGVNDEFIASLNKTNDLIVGGPKFQQP
ncbi:RmlC-like cupin domain superfamily protein [Abortiporus biennis]